MKARDYIPALYEGNKILPSDILDDRLPPVGNVYYVKKTTDADYDAFFTNFNYVNNVGKNSVQNTITAGIALLQNYDTLIICPGNYDEGGTITLDEKIGVKIFGYNDYMQWGEGSTNWRSVVSGNHLLKIQNCQGIEIAGIGFVIPTADKYAIQFVTELSYSCHIHHCSFTGDCGSGQAMSYGISADAVTQLADLHIDHCKFFRVKTAAIRYPGQRFVINDNIFIVPAAGHGINTIGQPNSYGVIIDNYFLGANSTDIGIYGSNSAGNVIIANNLFANMSSEIETDVDENCVNNYKYGAEGAITAVNPEE